MVIFVTLGSQKFQFNRILKRIDNLIEKQIITDEVFAQIGASDYLPKNYSYKDFLDKNEFDYVARKCDLVITHGGTGAIVGALKLGKKVIAVPRLSKYGEHVDDHQLQLLEQFSAMKYIEVCFDCDKLEDAISAVQSNTYNKYESNTTEIIKSIYEYIVELCEE